MARKNPIADDYLSIVDEIGKRIDLPKIERIFIPGVRDNPDKSAEFGAVILEDGSVGLMFMLLNETLEKIQDAFSFETFAGMNPIEVAQYFREENPLKRTLGLGAVNAIGQHVIRQSEFALDTETNSIASFNPTQQDRFGMIGYFPPLVERLRANSIDLTVIELKSELVERQGRFRVTLDPAALQQCNKVLCTSTMLLNDSIDAMLENCSSNAQIAIIGPSAGFLPDPLFQRGIETVGGNQVIDVEAFIDHCEKEEKWGSSSQKYCFHRASYPGYQALLDASE